MDRRKREGASERRRVYISAVHYLCIEGGEMEREGQKRNNTTGQLDTNGLYLINTHVRTCKALLQRHEGK